MSALYNNADIAVKITGLRNALRDGKANLPIRFTRDTLKTEVASLFGLKPVDLLDTTFISPRTQARFRTLFDTAPTDTTQNEVARALQNFLNRRKVPWSHVEAVSPADVAVAFAGDVGSGA